MRRKGLYSHRWDIKILVIVVYILFVFNLFYRLIFYTDNGTTPQLVRTRLNGSHRVVITKDSDIAAIAVDIETDSIVWAHDHSISIANIEGENRWVVKAATCYFMEMFHNQGTNISLKIESCVKSVSDFRLLILQGPEKIV